jgi:hypothetical protein
MRFVMTEDQRRGQSTAILMDLRNGIAAMRPMLEKRATEASEGFHPSDVIIYDGSAAGCVRLSRMGRSSAAINFRFDLRPGWEWVPSVTITWSMADYQVDEALLALELQRRAIHIAAWLQVAMREELEGVMRETANRFRQDSKA